MIPNNTDLLDIFHLLDHVEVRSAGNGGKARGGGGRILKSLHPSNLIVIVVVSSSSSADPSIFIFSISAHFLERTSRMTF